MQATKKLTINSLPAANVDIGYIGMPGSQADQIKCKISARRDGRWEAEGYYSTGTNQGYYQENYSYGPWAGRGDTPRQAVDSMVRRADSEYQDKMRKAGHDALLECDGETFASLATRELERLENVIANGEKEGAKYTTIAGERYYVPADARNELRKKAVKILRKIVATDAGPLADITDEDLIAEAKRRGFSISRVG